MSSLVDALTIDHKLLVAETDRLLRQIFQAQTDTIKDSTRKLEHELEASTRAAVPGNLWRAWRSESYPSNGGPAREPVGEVFVNGGPRSQGAMQFFTRSGRATAKDGFWLAIPLPAAGSRGRLRNLTPAEWERMTGIKLRFVYRRGKSALLVADEGTGNRRTGGLRRTGAAGRSGSARHGDSVPIFALVPYVRFKNSFAIEPIVSRIAGGLARDFANRANALRSGSGASAAL